MELSDQHSVKLDEALAITSFGKFNYILIILSGTVLSTLLLETLPISFVIPVACELNLTTTEKGLLSTISFIGVISSSLLWGYLADMYGRRKIIMPTLFISFLFTTIGTLTTNFALLVTMRYFSGFFVSGSSVTIYAYIGEFHSYKNRSRSIMGAAIVYGLFCTMSPCLAWLIINQEFSFYIPLIGTLYKPWRLYLFVCGLPCLICSLVLLKMPESPKFVFKMKSSKQTIEILKKMYSINTGQDLVFQKKLVQETNSVENYDIRRISDLFRPPFINLTLIGSFIFFCTYGASFGTYVWFPDIINKVLAYTQNNPNGKNTICEIINSTNTTVSTELSSCSEKLDTSTFHITIILEVMLTIGYAVICLLINPIGKLPILIFILVSTGAFGFLTVFINIPIVSIYSWLALIYSAISFPVINAAIVDLYPTKHRAMAVCLFLMIGLLGSVFVSNFFGIIVERYCSAGYILVGGLLIVCGILALFIPKIEKITEES